MPHDPDQVGTLWKPGSNPGGAASGRGGRYLERGARCSRPARPPRLGCSGKVQFRRFVPRPVAVLSDRDILKAMEAKRLRIGGVQAGGAAPAGGRPAPAGGGGVAPGGGGARGGGPEGPAPNPVGAVPP